MTMDGIGRQYPIPFLQPKLNDLGMIIGRVFYTFQIAHPFFF